MVDIARIKKIVRIRSNVAEMARQNAPSADIDGYIASEGVTAADLRRSPRPAGHPEFDPANVPGGVPRYNPETGMVEYTTPMDKVGAFPTSAIEGVPIAGPVLLKGVNAAALACSRRLRRPPTARSCGAG